MDDELTDDELVWKEEQEKFQDRAAVYAGQRIHERMDALIYGMCGAHIKKGETYIIDLSKGPNQLIFPDDGKEITVTAEAIEDEEPKLLTDGKEGD